MRKKYSKKNFKKLIVELCIFIFLAICGYFGYDYIYLGENIGNEEKLQKVSTNTYIGNADYVELYNDKLNIIFFYVGQADSTFIKLNNSCILIDAGNDADGEKIANFLKKNSITKLDYIIGTHADEDHIGGMDKVINQVDVNKILLPKIGSKSNEYKEVTKIASKRNIEIENPVRGDIFYISNAKCEVMSALDNEEVSDNNSSIVIQMEYINTKYLFMGDAEKEVENSRKWDKVDVLKVGHHGSNSSSSDTFLNEVNPKYAIIEVGKDNSYNLPSKKVIERLTNIGCNILRTDKAYEESVGSFWLNSDGNNIEIKTININLDGNA